MLIRSASGLRGIAEDHFTPELIDKYISAFIITQNIKSCVIGRDGRPSGKQITQWVINALTKNGVNVDDCYLVTTPTVQLMTEIDKYDGGIIITASHNPSEYNGLKFLQKDGTFLSAEQCKVLYNVADNEALNIISNHNGNLKTNVKSSHVSEVIESVFGGSYAPLLNYKMSGYHNDSDSYIDFTHIINNNSGSLWDMRYKLFDKDCEIWSNPNEFMDNFPMGFDHYHHGSINNSNDLFKFLVHHTAKKVYEEEREDGPYFYDSNNPPPETPDPNRSYHEPGHIITFEEKVIDMLRLRKFKVVVDAVNGGASNLLPELCRELGCEVITINCNGDGNFNRNPEPLSSNLKELESKVIEVGADIGFATDPDGDRLSIVSGSGKAIGEEWTLVLAGMSFKIHMYQYLLANGEGPVYSKSKELIESHEYTKDSTKIVTNLSTSQMVEHLGIPVIRSKIGEAHVVEKMLEKESIFGGEGNGGVIFKNAHLGRDSLVAAAFILKLLLHDWDQTLDAEIRHSNDNFVCLRTIDEIIHHMPHYILIKDKIKLDDSIDFDNLDTLFDCDEINKDDGIKFIWPNKWIHIRKSNTEPIIRIFAEAKTQEEVDELINTLKNYLK